MSGTRYRVSGGNTIRVQEILGSPSIFLVPTVREFVPKAGSDGEIGTQLENVLNVSGAFYRPPIHHIAIGSTHPVAGGPLQERKEAGKVGLSIVSSRGVRIDLDSLKPASKTQLVFP